MTLSGIAERVRFIINRLREQLWVMPLVVGLLSIGTALIARAADGTRLDQIMPEIAADSVNSLLSVMASSMLVIATFAVGSMVSAYAFASSNASPRSLPLVIADDSSQRALSAFIGAFIFSIVGLIALNNGYFGTAGRFVLFLFTIIVFGIVVFTFVRWVDSIARLGRLANTIDKVEIATAAALKRRRKAPALHGLPAATVSASTTGEPVFAKTIGYVQRIDVASLQSCAEALDGRIRVAVLPGKFVMPQIAVAYIDSASNTGEDLDHQEIIEAFKIGKERRFDDDPRYGLTVLSQIAGRALSPGINDPGTAIDVIGMLVRLFVIWSSPDDEHDSSDVKYDRVVVPELSTREMFDDAFTAIARDGSNSVEVVMRLHKALSSLASTGDSSMREAATDHAQQAVAYAEKALVLPEHLAMVREMADFAHNPHEEDGEDP
ncbi:MAG: DUF2254 domain-containing protein [Armatimonadota bacterium]